MVSGAFSDSSKLLGETVLIPKIYPIDYDEINDFPKLTEEMIVNEI